MKKNKITIELYSLLRDILKNIWVVILSALIGAMGFYLVTHAAYEEHSVLEAYLDKALERVERCFQNVDNKYFKNELGG